MTLYEYAKGAVWLAGLATGACAFTHSVVRADVSANIGKALASYNLTVAVRRWPSHFVELFDSLFGKQHWTWFCFYRSCYCSLGGLGAVTFTYFVLSPASFFHFVNERVIVGTAFLMVSFNLLADFLSLLETRWLINRLGRNPSLKKLVAVLLLDLILTATIFIVSVSALITWGFLNRPEEGRNLMRLASVLFNLWSTVIMTPPSGDFATAFRLAFYTTFLTSVWVWMLSAIPQ